MILVVVVGATLTLLESGSRTQRSDEAFAQEITSAQVAVARLTHDLREAQTIVSASPNMLEFLMPATQTVNGTSQTVTLDIRYDCTQSDSLGAPYTRCARTESTYPNPVPAPSATASSVDIAHVENGAINTYCNGSGSAPSGSVFFYSNSNTTNPDASPPPCDENYQGIVAARPDFVQVLIRVPASGDLPSGGLNHATVLSSGVYLRNWNLGA